MPAVQSVNTRGTHMRFHRLPITSAAFFVLLWTRGTWGADAAANELHLLALGDWGINSPERGRVGAEMGNFASKNGNRSAAVLLLGDNFYVKLSGVDDPQIQSFFEQTYDPKKLDVPFYAVMGNHDYSTKNWPIEMEYARSGS